MFAQSLFKIIRVLGVEGVKIDIVDKAEAAMFVMKPDGQWKLAMILLPESIPVSEEDK